MPEAVREGDSEVSMPGNWWRTGDHRLTGSSLRPPRHWRTKAKKARVRGRRVRRKSSRDANAWYADADDDDEEERDDEEEGLLE